MPELQFLREDQECFDLYCSAGAEAPSTQRASFGHETVKTASIRVATSVESAPSFRALRGLTIHLLLHLIINGNLGPLRFLEELPGFLHEFLRVLKPTARASAAWFRISIWSRGLSISYMA